MTPPQACTRAANALEMSLRLVRTTTGELLTRANGDLTDRIGRPTEAGPVRMYSACASVLSHPPQICIVDPECRMIGLHMYDGAFKVIPISQDGSLREAFNIRLEELRVSCIAVSYFHLAAEAAQVVSMTFVHGTARPTLALIYQAWHFVFPPSDCLTLVSRMCTRCCT